MGARTWILEAATYGDVDSLILADALSDSNTEYLDVLRAQTVAASSLPQFAGLPDGYRTITRRDLFYDTALADPAVIARDAEIGMDTGTIGQISTLPVGDQLRQYSQSITVPVLIVVGSQDANSCNPAIGLSCADSDAVIEREATSYSSTSCLGAFVLDAGHNTNLHPAARTWYRYANWWLNRVSSANPSHDGARQPCALDRR